jgi:anti-sigma regulatory factor (Ser/Thr protein kinase)
MVRYQLEAWGLSAELPALELAVSELVTNAIVHGCGQVDVRIADLDGSVRLEVGDEGTVGTPRPTMRSDGSDGAGGWGLRLVEGLSDTWGTHRDGGRTQVWMERRTDGRAPGEP